MIDIWFPKLIRKFKQKSQQISQKSNATKCINTYCDGEVNRIVGWALFSCIKKHKKIQQISNEKKDSNTADILDMLRDMKALEADIIQDEDYIRRYYLVDDAIRNKGELNLISKP